MFAAAIFIPATRPAYPIWWVAQRDYACTCLPPRWMMPNLDAGGASPRATAAVECRPVFGGQCDNLRRRSPPDDWRRGLRVNFRPKLS